MKITRWTMAVVLLVGLAGSTQAKKRDSVQTRVDPVAGDTTVTLENSYLKTGFRPTLQIGASATVAQGTGSVSFILTVDAPVWLFLDGVSVNVLADDQRFSIPFHEIDSDVSGADNGVDSVDCQEILSGSVDKATLDKMANAKSLLLEVGIPSLTFKMKDEWIGTLKEFDAAVVQAGWLGTNTAADPVAPPNPAPVPAQVVSVRTAFANMVASVNPGVRVEFSGDTMTVHSPGGTKDKFDTSVATFTPALVKALQIKTFIYTNDNGLTFTHVF